MLRTLFILCFIGILAGCMPDHHTATTTQSPFEPYNHNTPVFDTQMVVPQNDNAAPTQPVVQRANGKVALLLPLTGTQASIGESLLHASQMAIFDSADPTFDVLVFDTQSSEQGTKTATQKAVNANVKLILGPLLGDNVQMAGHIARGYGLSVIGFTTNERKVGGNTVTLGILPFDQGKRMAEYAAMNRLMRIAVIAPQTSYAKAVIAAFENEARNHGIQITQNILLTSGYNATELALQLKANATSFDALFMPVGHPQIATLAHALKDQGLAPQTKTWLGTGLWEDKSVLSNPVMAGAVYAAPSPTDRQNFERRYQSTFGGQPHRLASLSYDATALAMNLLRQNQSGIPHHAIQNPNGFAGIDGIFRIQPNGLAERGLAIHKITGAGQSNILIPAPTSFLKTGR